MRRAVGVLLVVAALLAVPAVLHAQDPGTTPAAARLVVLGVDGMDHALTTEFLQAGHLPELRALAEQGTFRALEPTNPAQSPTSWASLVSGLQPGRTGIFGFLRREIRDGQVIPRMGLVEAGEKPLLGKGLRWLGYLAVVLIALIPWILFRRWRIAPWISIALLAFLILALRWIYAGVPESVTSPRNLRRGAALWEGLDRDGVAVTSLFAPCAFPAPELDHGHLLCGLGVPDLAGTPGFVSVFRDEPVPPERRETPMGGRDVPLVRAADGVRLEGADLLGPRNPLTKATMRVPLGLVATPDGVDIEIQDQRTTLTAGRFTDFLPVRFEWSHVMPSLQGLLRFRLLRGAPNPVIYQEPVQFDPRAQIPWAPLTHPLAWGTDLARSGLFETVGWATATNPYQDGLIDDATMIEDVASVVARQEAMILEQLDKGGWRVHFSVLSTPDRVQHVFWRDRDREHPAHDAAGAAARGDQILRSYQDVDRIVGRIRKEVLRESDVLLVVSDHGFAPFRWAVNLNRWLAQEGWLVARADGTRTLRQNLDQPVTNVDWSKTKAYSLELGRIWLNVKGREPEGTVDPADAPALARAIADKLLALTHEGRRVVRSVRTAAELYHGDAVPDAADLVVGFESGYRVSWSSCLLGMDEPMIFENKTRWSGDHCSVDPSLVPGVLFATTRLPERAATVVDVYPTIRALLGLAPAPDLDGRSLTESP